MYAVSSTAPKSISDPVNATFSEWTSSAGSVATRAIFSVEESIGIVVAPARIKPLSARALSMTLAASGSGTRIPADGFAVVDNARCSAGASDQSTTIKARIARPSESGSPPLCKSENRCSRDSVRTTLPVLASSAVYTLGGLTFAAMVEWYRLYRSVRVVVQEATYCPSCGADLSGKQSFVCRSCWNAFSLEDLRTAPVRTDAAAKPDGDS